MEVQLAILIVSFIAMLLLKVPIAIAIGAAALLAVVSLGDVPANYIVAQRMSKGIASFSLLAIPFFVLAGLLMGEGGMARRLINFASALVGQFRGGLSYVSTITCMMFGTISGSATAAVSSVGGMMIPEMVHKGYSREYSVAVTTTAATTGLVIPPSNIMIVFAVVAGDISVASMFMAGIIPGIIIGLAIMAVCWLMRKRHGFESGGRIAWKKMVEATTGSFLSLGLVVVVLQGILSGWFSPTEAAAIAVLYAFIVTVFIYREIKFSDLPRILLKTSITTAVVFLLIGTSQAMSWVMAYLNLPQSASAVLLSVSENPLAILAMMNLMLLCVGTFMDMTPAVLIFTPIFLPVAQDLGMHPVHFGIMMIVNLCIGLCTPPVGTCLFLGCGVGKTSIAAVTRPMIPFFFAMFVALVLITYIPALSMWLPQQLGLE
ncbi:MAG: TRAP transporter large permease [Pirellulales bacterium]|nr:TRAP transporter large permease [Pirellulales bacterium]